jgi:hypothetical protein
VAQQSWAGNYKRRCYLRFFEIEDVVKRGLYAVGKSFLDRKKQAEE